MLLLYYLRFPLYQTTSCPIIMLRLIIERSNWNCTLHSACLCNCKLCRQKQRQASALTLVVVSEELFWRETRSVCGPEIGSGRQTWRCTWTSDAYTWQSFGGGYIMDSTRMILRLAFYLPSRHRHRHQHQTPSDLQLSPAITITITITITDTNHEHSRRGMSNYYEARSYYHQQPTNGTVQS